MDRDEATFAFVTLEKRTFAWVDSDAPADDWPDENTPPTRTAPSLDVRLDAQIDKNGERSWRIFARTHPWLNAEQTAKAIMESLDVAQEAGAEISLANNGIEIR